MSIPNFKLPFNQHNTQKFDIRNRPEKYAQSDLRSWRFEQSEGIRPAEYYAPYKYLPVAFKDVTTEDYVVLPKGRVVSVLSAEDSTPVSGIVYPNSSGSVAIGTSAAELGSNLITVNIDSSIFGYDDGIAGLLTLANGGQPLSGFYTAADVTAGSMSIGGAAATASGGFLLPANAPVGVVYTDWYQDIRGANLNYRMHPDGGHVLTDWYVEVPYVKATNAFASGCSPRYKNNNYNSLTSWWDINEKFTYLAIEQGEAFRTGYFVQSDLLGNYKPQTVLTSTGTSINASGSAPAALTLDSALIQVKTNQTVGKILSIDNRMPKWGLEDVLTYPRSGMTGSQTAGMIKVLFDFAYFCLKIGPYGGVGTAPTVEQVYNRIRDGWFGLARIQLLVS